MHQIRMNIEIVHAMHHNLLLLINVFCELPMHPVHIGVPRLSFIVSYELSMLWLAYSLLSSRRIHQTSWVHAGGLQPTLFSCHAQSFW